MTTLAYTLTDSTTMLRRNLKHAVRYPVLTLMVGGIPVVLLLLFVFLSTNIAVLVLRKDEVAADHFRVWAVIPVLAVASCVLLLWQQEAGTWLRAGALLVVGVVLYLLAQAPWWRSTEEPAREEKAPTAS